MSVDTQVFGGLSEAKLDETMKLGPAAIAVFNNP